MKIIFLLFILISILFFGCQTENISSLNKNLTIGGSDTEFEVVNLLIETYHNTYENKIDLQGGGSEMGIQKLLRKEVQMANSSRKLNSNEREEMSQANIMLTEIVFAYDALAIICHPSLRIDSISTLQLSQIFRGEIKNWNEIGGIDLPITIYGRDIHSGTRTYVENRFVRNEGFSDNYIETSGNNEIIEKVKKDKGGVGFVGVGYIMNQYGMPAHDVWAISLYCEGGRAHSPYETVSVLNKEYDLLRPLYQYINNDYLTSFKDFIKFELSEEGQHVIKEAGFYPIDEDLNKINSKLLGF